MTVACRVLRPGDAPRLLALLQQVRPALAGLASASVYRAFIREALRGTDVFCVVAGQDDQLHGYVLAARDWQRFQRRFLLRHPRLAFQIVGQRLCTRRRQPSSAAAAAADSPGPQWEQSSPTIAKILHIGVDPSMRGRGVGASLYSFLLPFLERQGIQRVDACVAAENRASLRLHERLGWTLRKDPDHYFAFYSIGGEVNDAAASEACSRG